MKHPFVIEGAHNSVQNQKILFGNIETNHYPSSILTASESDFFGRLLTLFVLTVLRPCRCSHHSGNIAKQKVENSLFDEILNVLVYFR